MGLDSAEESDVLNPPKLLTDLLLPNSLFKLNSITGALERLEMTNDDYVYCTQIANDLYCILWKGMQALKLENAVFKVQGDELRLKELAMLEQERKYFAIANYKDQRVYITGGKKFE